MAMRRSLLQWSGILVVVVLIFALGIEAKGTTEPSGENSDKRADIITIDTLKSFGALERQEVTFFHDLHTEALEKTKKDCKTCHLPEKPNQEKLSLKFKRLEDTTKQEVMDIYHSECIGCHKDMAAPDQVAGPIEICGQCHKDEVGVISSRQPMGFDKSLHFRHTQATKDEKTNKSDCGLCHHEYDEKAKKLFHAKEKEGSCRYCHKNETQENRSSMRLASHSGCIDCHKQKLAEKKEAGPSKCNGCHDLEEQKKVKKVETVPRIERKQPDVVLIRADKEGSKKEEQVARMNPVPFNHKAHEGYNETCIECHHASLDSCSKKCHTTAGSKDGDFVSLERAMHQKGYEKSCLGCHDINQNEPKCAACHESMAKDLKADSSCLLCHMKPLADPAESNEIMAEMLLKTRKATADTYKDEDIPEKVIIKDLSDKYEPVELPHRKMIKTLLTNIKDNKMAGYFHAEKGTVCQSCHHNSPIDKKPPRCGSCHSKPFDKNALTRPGIKGAYHQQCMECHTILNLEKPKATACTECHKEKKK
jgi:hypothetical protein